MKIDFIGEHLFVGVAGHYSLLLAFLAVVFSAFSYYLASGKNHHQKIRWQKRGRIFFLGHGFLVAVAGIFLLIILLNRFYEYRYAWMHIENDLSLGYRIAAFWAGQEGSMLFWTLCQAFFGMLMIRYARTWEPKIMTLLSLSQVFMVAMLLGLKIGPFTLGSDPFLLLRLTQDNMQNPFFQNPEYLALIHDGNGLNPLLRNFWMLSHPPLLFIGYAAALVPFCYALAGLWNRQYVAWIRPALPWMILAIFFLGAGILLGGVWAYESLTFGGFWAWDPIENASLVPWLAMVASLHLMLIAKKKKNTLFPAFLFTILSFILVIYATFLTRSGVLSETSVHSFGNDGMGRQIAIYIFTFLAMGMWLLIKNFPHLPVKDDEEPFSREFWLFIGSLVLVLSGLQIIFTTSIPVVNALFGSNMTAPSDVMEHYNNWQLPFAVVVSVLIGFVHYIRWDRNNVRKFLWSVGLPLMLALLFYVLIAGFYQVIGLGNKLLLFSSLFAFFSSLDMILRFRRQYVSFAAALTHLGMAMFLLAVLLTFSNKEVISKNTSGFSLGQAFPDNENLLMVKDEILPMGEYFVTYKGHEMVGDRKVFQIDFLKKNQQDQYYKVFSSHPAILLNEKMGNVYEPYSKFLPLKDVFTYVSFADIHETEDHDDALLQTVEIAMNDTLQVQNHLMVLHDITTPSGSEALNPDDIRIDALLEVISPSGAVHQARPAFMVQQGHVGHLDAAIQDLNWNLRFRKVSDKPYTIVVEVFEPRPDFIIIKTVIFPFINLLWASCLVILAGLIMSFRHRWRKSPQEVQKLAEYEK
ncbi:MAG: cytochrome c biogenesis protein CcsA [Bacteroidales bacterium]